MSTYVEPAIKSYFFGKGYRDLRDVIKESWQRNIMSAEDFFSKIDSSGEWWMTVFLMVFWGGAGISVVVFGSILFLVISLFHILLLGIFFSVIYIGFTVVWVVEKIYLLVHHFFAACPHCHEKNTLPEYLCDSCGRVHARLMPNSYGILYHRCICGQKLPATFFVNRGRLQARCPNNSCHQFLHREHVETHRIFIPILGGPYVGKTAFMFAAVRNLIEEKASRLGFSTEFIDKATEAEYNKVVTELRQGHVPGKTIANTPKAFNIALKKHNKTKWLLYIYDPSGEAFQNTGDLLTHRYQEYLSGMVLIVDPFSISSVRRKYEYELSKTWTSVNPSQLNVEDALTRVILTMQESFGLSETGKIKCPLAIVISKVDAFGLEEVLGESAVNKILSEDKSANRIEVRNNLIKKQLFDWGEVALLQQLDMRFKNVRYFSCSALGRIPDASGKDFFSHHVIEPILWICSSVNAKDFPAPK